MPTWLVLEPIVIVSSVTAISALLIGAVAQRNASKKVVLLEKQLSELGNELNALSHSTIGMGRKLQTVAEKHDHLEITVEEIERNDPVKVSYSEAGRLVKMGASVEELMSACGISRPEAELVSALTKQNIAQSITKNVTGSVADKVTADVTEGNESKIPTLDAKL